MSIDRSRFAGSGVYCFYWVFCWCGKKFVLVKNFLIIEDNHCFDEDDNNNVQVKKQRDK